MHLHHAGDAAWKIGLSAAEIDSYKIGRIAKIGAEVGSQVLKTAHPGLSAADIPMVKEEESGSSNGSALVIGYHGRYAAFSERVGLSGVAALCPKLPN